MTTGTISPRRARLSARGVARSVLSKLGSVALVLLVTSFAVFAALHLAPGSPEQFLVRGNSVTEEALQAIRNQYHLDDPFLVQYLKWIGGVVTGDFGRSIQFRQPVLDLILSRVPTTLSLVLYSAALILVVGVLLGVLASVRRGIVDGAVIVATTLSMAMPAFVVAMALTSLFAVTLRIFPSFGAGDGFLDRIWHLTLPAISLAMSSVALVMRTTRSAMIESLGREFIDTARVRGFSSRRIIWRHAFRAAIVPVVTLAGLVLAGLLVTTTIVETVFGLNGIGSLLVQAVNVKDFPVVQAVVLIIVTVFVLANLVVDLLYPVLDPRTRVRGESR